jgi:hypothetical protein
MIPSWALIVELGPGVSYVLWSDWHVTHKPMYTNTKFGGH